MLSTRLMSVDGMSLSATSIHARPLFAQPSPVATQSMKPHQRPSTFPTNFQPISLACLVALAGTGGHDAAVVRGNPSPRHLEDEIRGDDCADKTAPIPPGFPRTMMATASATAWKWQPAPIPLLRGRSSRSPPLSTTGPTSPHFSRGVGQALYRGGDDRLTPAAWAAVDSGILATTNGNLTRDALHSAGPFYRVLVDDLDSDGDGVSDWAERPPDTTRITSRTGR